MRKQIAESRNSDTRLPESDARFVYSAPELAEAFGVSDRTVTRLVRRGMPRLKHGTYDVRACVRWQLAQLKVDEPTGLSAQDELAIAQHARVELETAQKRASLLPVELARLVLAQLAAIAGDELEAVADCAGELAELEDPQRIQARLHARTRETRRAIAGRLAALAADVERGEAFEAAED